MSSKTVKELEAMFHPRSVAIIGASNKEGKIGLEQVDADCIAGHLYTAGLIEPDLLIRTANEMRISNFLLWQISYAEFYVTQRLWPDFEREDLEEAIRVYAGRVRRFGDIVSSED